MQWIDCPNNWRIHPGNLKLCSECGGLYTKDGMRGHSEWHSSKLTEDRKMSNVSWCDNGNHAFKSGEPGSQAFRGTSIDENGMSVSMAMDSCAHHAYVPKAISKSEPPQDSV